MIPRLWKIWLWLTIAGCPLIGAEGWIALSSPPLELYTNGPEKTARAIFQHLERIGQVFHAASGMKRSPLPVRVFVFASERGFRPFRPSESTAAFYQAAAERDYVVMHLSSGDAPRRIAFHEYVHVALNHSSAPLPRWLEEGIAEFYSTLEITGGRLRIGGVIREHLYTLSREKWLSAAELGAVDRDSPFYNERSKVGRFYAQSWALVHMLNLSPGYRERLPDFAGLLAAGEPRSAAFAKAFGKTFEEAMKDLAGYAGGRQFRVIEAAADHYEELPRPAVRPLSPHEIDLAQAELFLALGRREQAEKIYREIAARDGESAEVETALGAMALALGRREEARRRLERAVELGSSAASTYFEYAALLRESGSGPAAVEANLRKAIGLNPHFAEAHFLLGSMAAAGGRHEEAAHLLRRAAEILPRNSNIWEALAHAYLELGNRELARRAAYRALEGATSERETRIARAVIKLAEAEPATAVEKRSAVILPDSWLPPKPDARLEGSLFQVDCLDGAARLHVRAAGQVWKMLVKDPRKVFLRNAGEANFEFRCGPLSPIRMAIEYQANPEAALGTAGQVTALEFLPPRPPGAIR